MTPSTARATAAATAPRSAVDGPRPPAPRWPALDGLRALAIVAVVVFHYPVPTQLFRGGFFGVGVFFVLSGFLITTGLLAEGDRHGRVRLGRFYRRRFWRLVPALAVLLAVVLLVAARFGAAGWFSSAPFGPPHAPGPPTSVASLLWPAAAALGYVANLPLAFDVPMPPQFGHLWTLSVEGQFYLLWGLLTAALVRRRRALAAATGALVLVSGALPFLVWGSRPGIQDWIYFGTVPQLVQLGAGALLAQLWAAGLLRRVPAGLLRWCGAAAAAVLAWLLLAVSGAPLQFLGGPQLVALCGGLLVAALLDERTGSPGAALLALPPLVWLGRRSYGVYLWHWPLALWTNELPRQLGLPLGLLGSVLLAELSWRLVERPAQRFGRPRPGAAPPPRWETITGT